MRLRKKTIAVTTAAFVIAGTTAALAFWTTGGSGNGSTTTATATDGVVLTAAVTGGPLVPGSSQTIDVTADNPNNAVVELGEISFAVTTSSLDCGAENFTIDPIPGTQVVANAVGQAIGGTVITFVDTGLNQDACKGVDVNFTMTAAAPAVA